MNEVLGKHGGHRREGRSTLVGKGVMGAASGTGAQWLGLALKLKSWETKGWVGSVV